MISARRSPGIPRADLDCSPEKFDGLLQSAFDQDRTPRLIVTHGLEIVTANRAAFQFIELQPGLNIVQERFSVLDEADNKRLHDFVSRGKSDGRTLILGETLSDKVIVHLQCVKIARQVVFELVLHSLTIEREHQASTIAVRFSLTPTEEMIVSALLEGDSMREISDDRNCAFETIRSHVRSIYRKININSRVELLQLARSSGAVSI